MEERDYIPDVYEIFEDDSISGREKRLRLEKVGVKSLSGLMFYVEALCVRGESMHYSRDVIRKLVGSKVGDVLLAYVAGKNSRSNNDDA